MRFGLFAIPSKRMFPLRISASLALETFWTWTAICADMKLVPAFFVGLRDAACAYHFMTNLAGRLKNRIQLTTDGHKAYLSAVEDAFGSNIDFAQLVKLYGAPPANDTRYSPAECIGTAVSEVSGNPDPEYISTSYVERQNLTMRMCMRRFTRLTNAFSKKIDNHIHALSLFYMHYNFGRIHQTLRVTPAMEAGVSNHIWTVQEIVELTNQLSLVAA
jgi:IS1 family transposase